jgi:two-component system, NtrC family, response regulator AtoC
MPDRAILYGAVVAQEDRQALLDRCDANPKLLLCPETATLPERPVVPSLIFVDLDDPAFAKPDFLASLATAGSQVTLIGKTVQPSMDISLRVSKFGVAEVLTPDQCLKRLDQFLKQLEAPPKPVAADNGGLRYTTRAIIGNSAQTTEIRKTIKLLGEVDFPSALILGETGTGKNLISRVLHHCGGRASHNLVEVNCSAIPDELFESELFGHVKGAFTGAASDKVGLFEFAQHGTIFLDEIGNLSSSAQAKMLKILEDKRLRKVGAVNSEDIDVRVIAATNRDLERALETGAFRSDLYYRLNLLTIRIPPLRERPEDIPPMVEHYLDYYATNYAKPGIVIDEETLDLLREYRWPGNVRELCNVVERAVLLNRSGVIKSSDINVALKSSRLTVADRCQIVVEVPPQGITMEEIEREVVLQVLNACRWNKSEAARLLSISRPRLRRILDKSGLDQNRRRY